MTCRMRLGIEVLPIVVGLGLAGCAPSGGPGYTPPRTELVTAGELSGTSAGSLYEALQRLRPLFLQSRGPTSLTLPTTGGPVVWVDGTLMGGLEWLQWLPPRDVATVQRLSAWDAATIYGGRFPDGVLVVTTRRGR